MVNVKRTTKRVRGSFTLTFHGDYIAEDVAQYFEGWVDSGLNDREDLMAWGFTVTDVDEVEGDPDGYDR